MFELLHKRSVGQGAKLHAGKRLPLLLDGKGDLNRDYPELVGHSLVTPLDH